jgi:hypothetical protein
MISKDLVPVRSSKELDTVPDSPCPLWDASVRAALVGVSVITRDENALPDEKKILLSLQARKLDKLVYQLDHPEPYGESLPQRAEWDVYS